jgi:7,8-dihydroneopterin aldolase/epimerase/oxygenase
MTDRIEVRGLRLSALVGVLAGERLAAQPLAFDLDLARPFEAAARGDALDETTDYAAVVDLVEAIATQGSFLLLETLARRVARAVLDFDPRIESVTVAVRKLRPPIPQDADSLGVRTTLTR